MIQKLKILTPLTITTAGTRLQLTTSDISVYSVIIQAAKANTGSIYIGDSTVTSSNGTVLDPGDAMSIELKLPNELNLSDIYCDTATNGNIVRVEYITSRGV